MLEKLKKEVFQANLDLVKYGLVIFTWGNASGRSEDGKYMVIKPSGVEYDVMKASDMVVLEVASGKVVEGKYNPSSDTPTHLELYRAYSDMAGVVHTHSRMATAYAQAGLPIKAMGTTHADYFYGDIPCTRDLTEDEIKNEYEKNTGLVIVETFGEKGINPLEVPAVLVKNHGVFSFGKNAVEAVHNSVVAEEVASINYYAATLCGEEKRMPEVLLDKHFLRKHGKNAYYGQGGKK